jgi:hypothetical protein
VIHTPAGSTLAMHREPSRSVEPPPPEIPTAGNSLSEGTRPGVPQLGELELPSESVSVFAAGADYRVAYVHNGRLFVRGMKPRSEVQHALSAGEPASAVALGATHALVGRADGAIDQVHIESGAASRLFESVFKDAVTSLAMSADNRWLLAGTQGGRLYLKPPTRDERDWLRVRSGGEVSVVALSPQSDLFAVGRADGSVELSRTADPKGVKLKIMLRRAATHMAFSEDGYLLAICHDPTKISLYQAINGQHFLDIKLRSSRLMSFFFSLENNLMAFMSDQRNLFVMDLHSRQARHISFS